MNDFMLKKERWMFPNALCIIDTRLNMIIFRIIIECGQCGQCGRSTI